MDYCFLQLLVIFCSSWQCDFQVIYASGLKGQAGLAPENLAEDLGPLFETIIRCIPGPQIAKDGSLQMLVRSALYVEFTFFLASCIFYS